MIPPFSMVKWWFTDIIYTHTIIYMYIYIIFTHLIFIHG